MARNYCNDTDYKIGTSPAALVSLRMANIPIPDQVVHRPASVWYTRADLSRIGDGFAAVEWVWDVISINRLSSLLSFLGGATYASVYIKTDVRDGLNSPAASAFKVFSCKMWKPVLSGEEGAPIVRSPYALQSVQIRFVDLVEQVGYL